MAQIETDILVVGGGAAGLIATCLFASEGFHTICVDLAPPVVDENAPGADLRTTAFLTPSVDVLRRAGLWPTFSTIATPLDVMRLADAGGEAGVIRETADFTASEMQHDPFGWNLKNTTIRKVALERIEQLATASLRAPAALKQLITREKEAIALLSDGTQVRAKLVVAADGRDSAVRAAAAIDAPRHSYAQKALVFAVRHTVPHENVSTEIHRTGGPFTLVPLPDIDGQPCSSVVWMEEATKASALQDAANSPEGREAFTEAMNLRSCGILGRLDLVSPVMAWPMISMIADRLDGQRIALTAETAHVVPPIGAQGLNMSLKDMVTLADLMLDARHAGLDFGSADLLGKYNRVRRPEMLMRVKGVDALNRASMLESPALRDLRRAGLKLIYGFTPMRRTAMKMGMGAGTGA